MKNFTLKRRTRPTEAVLVSIIIKDTMSEFPCIFNFFHDKQKQILKQ